MSERWVGLTNQAGRMSSRSGDGKFVWIRLLDADPLDAAEDLPPLRVLDRVQEQTVMGASNARIDSYRHPQAATMLEIDGWAPAAAPADDDHFRRLAPQGFRVLEINGRQRLKHRSLSLRQRPCVHAMIVPSATAVSIRCCRNPRGCCEPWPCAGPTLN